MLGIDKRAAQYTWTAAVILLLLCLVYRMRTTLFVFIVALLFAYLLSPLVNIIDRLLPTSRTRTPALAVAYLIFIAALYVAVTQIGARIFEEANSFGKSVPALLAAWQQPSKKASPEMNSFKAQMIQKVREQVSKSSGDIVAAIPRAGVEVLSVASNLVYVVIVPILAFFFLKDGRMIAGQLVDMVDDGPRRSLLDDLLADTSLLLAHYMRAVLLLSLAAFTSYAICFIILGIPYGVLLAALAATLEFVPIIGPFVASMIILIVTGVSGGPILSALAFLLDLSLAPGLCTSSAVDGLRRGAASALRSLRRFRRRRDRGCPGGVPFRAGAGNRSHFLSAHTAGPRLGTPFRGQADRDSVKWLVRFGLLATPAWAHVMSMSSGDLTIQGADAHYELRLPLYEVTHIRNPDQALFEHIHFLSASQPARLLRKSCREDAAQGAYLCASDYEFAAPVKTLDVECTFYAVTVPNHVHLLRVENDGKRDQALFDISFPNATLRFRPPSAFETAAAQIGSGFMRALGGPVQILSRRPGAGRAYPP